MRRTVLALVALALLTLNAAAQEFVVIRSGEWIVFESVLRHDSRKTLAQKAQAVSSFLNAHPHELVMQAEGIYYVSPTTQATNSHTKSTTKKIMLGRLGIPSEVYTARVRATGAEHAYVLVGVGGSEYLVLDSRKPWPLSTQEAEALYEPLSRTYIASKPPVQVESKPE